MDILDIVKMTKKMVIHNLNCEYNLCKYCEFINNIEKDFKSKLDYYSNDLINKFS